MIDFTGYKRTKTFYGGSEKKFGIIIGKCEYMLKFQKYNNFGKKMHNHISEYIGSHIFELFNFVVQETHLGIYNGEEVVACKNFITDNNRRRWNLVFAYRERITCNSCFDCIYLR